MKNCKFTQTGLSYFGLVCKTQSDPWKVWSLELNERIPQRLGKCPRESSCPAILQLCQSGLSRAQQNPNSSTALEDMNLQLFFYPIPWEILKFEMSRKGKKRKKLTGEGGNIRIWFFKAVHFAVLERCVASKTYDGIKPSWLLGTGHKILQHNALCMYMSSIWTSPFYKHSFTISGISLSLPNKINLSSQFCFKCQCRR